MHIPRPARSESPVRFLPLNSDLRSFPSGELLTVEPTTRANATAEEKSTEAAERTSLRDTASASKRIREIFENVQTSPRRPQRLRDNYHFADQGQVAHATAAMSAASPISHSDDNLDPLQPDVCVLHTEIMPGHVHAKESTQIDSISESNPDDSALLFESEASLIPANTFNEAMASCDIATAPIMDNQNAIYLTAGLLRAFEYYPLALEFAKKAVSLSPYNPNYLREQARLMNLLGDTQGSLTLIERALALTPNDSLAHLERAAMLWKLGRFEEAIASDIALDTLDPLQAQFNFDQTR